MLLYRTIAHILVLQKHLIYPIIPRFTVIVEYLLYKGVQMKNKLFIILFIITLGAIASYVLSGSLLIYVLALLLGGTVLYFRKINTKNRKENLNIIRDENKLYFYLSDDLLFSVDLLRNKSITETLRTSIKKEMSTIHNITRKICFINFKDDDLLKELNSSLEIK